MPYIVVFDELAATANREADGRHHPFALRDAGIFSLLVFDVDVERLTLEEEFEIAVML